MFSRLRSWLRAVLGRNRLESEMDLEMRFHVEAYEADLVRCGIAPDEARRRARMEFGNLESAKQGCRESRGLRWTDEFLRNILYTLRTLKRSPGFTIAAVLTLALCIGANTAIFSVIDAALFRPLPFPEPEKLVQVVRHYRLRGIDELDAGQDGLTWEIIHRNATSFDCAASGFGFTGVNLVAQGKAEYVEQHRVSASYFHVIGVLPALGREFSREEDTAGGPQATVLSHALWKRMFDGDPRLLGKTILLRGEPYVVVGIMPAGYRPLVTADLWTPLRPSRNGEGGGTNYGLIARIHDGSSAAQANAELRMLGRQILDERQRRDGALLGYEFEPLQRAMAQDIRKPLLVLWSAVGLVLLIGCLNVAGLLLIRATGRTREIATRVALGGRAAVVRQMLTESMVLAFLGGLTGVLLGWAGIAGLSTFALRDFGIWEELRLDWRVLLVTLAVSALTSLLFGLLPAMKAARADVRSGLTEGGAHGIAGGTSRWPRRALVLGELALGMVLLVSAGLLIRTFLHFRQLTPGFDPDHVVAASLSLQDARYSTKASITQLFDETLDRIHNIPGIESAAVGLSLPYERWLNMSFLREEEIGTDAHPTITGLNYVTTGYFHTLRIPVLTGRVFDARDNAKSEPVAVVNRSFMRQYLRDEEVGTSILVSGEKLPRRIVGVVSDLQQHPGWGSTKPLLSQPAVYLPIEQFPEDWFPMIHTWFAPKWVVRAQVPRQRLVMAIQQAVEQIDPALPFAWFKTLDDLRDGTLAPQRLNAALLGALAGLALLLAAVGVYGLIANSMVQRRREMGIRVALGASYSNIVSSVAMPGVGLAAAGVALGGALAAVAVRFLQTLVYDLPLLDPLTFVGVGTVLLVVACGA
ncbi:MAG: ABC transporter permease, partial [Acidobacteriota bacterium]